LFPIPSCNDQVRRPHTSGFVERLDALRWVLEVGVHDTSEGAFAGPQTLDDRSTEPAGAILQTTVDHINGYLVFEFALPDDGRRIVVAIVDEEHLHQLREVDGRKAIEKRSNVVAFIPSGNDY
jgi:hypothetical protein